MPGRDAHVQAAGGLVVRDDGRVAVVHRPKYDDWSLPKGKLVKGESFEDAALREVEEETGARAVLREELPSDAYIDPKGRPKTVRWWRMDVADEGRFTASAEVDEVRWLTPEQADTLLSYEHDRGLVARLR
jgi:8-oxo-dGTP diphosphatase